MREKIVIMFMTLLLTSTAAICQRQGVGLRLGDPIGVTYKQYSGSGKAIEFLLGTAAPHWHHNYYENSFYNYDKYNGDTYRSHKVLNSVYLQARYLFHHDIMMEGLEGSLQWYWGVGGMLKFSRIKYQYYTALPEANPGVDVHSNIDFGPEGIGGVEYNFEDVPITVFGETSLMFELADRPLTLQLYGAVGVRFNF